MKNAEWYYKKILNKIDESKLSRKVMWNIVVVILFFTVGSLGTLIMISSLIKGVYFNVDIQNTNYFWGIGTVCSMAFILIINDNLNPLNKLNMNDKIFCWMHYLMKQIKLYIYNKKYSFLQKIRIKFIIKIINKDLYMVNNNLDNSFVFLKDKEKTVKKVSNLMKLFNICIKNNEETEKIMKILEGIEKQYLLLVSNKLLYSETDINISKVSKEIEESFNEQYDKLFNNLEVLIDNSMIPPKPVRNLLYSKRKHVILFILVIAGISLIYLIFKDETLATMIGSIVGVLVALFEGIRYIMKDKED